MNLSKSFLVTFTFNTDQEFHIAWNNLGFVLAIDKLIFYDISCW